MGVETNNSNPVLSFRDKLQHIEKPIVAVIGKRGDGKGLYFVERAKEAITQGRKVFANFTLHGIEYKHITFDEIEKIPAYLKEGVLLLDELDVGADSYSFNNATARAIYTISAQSRKIDLDIFYATQLFSKVPKRLRNMTDVIVEMRRITYFFDKKGVMIKGFSEYKIFDYREPPEMLIEHGLLDGREHFENYDTNEIIRRGHSVGDEDFPD
jgi:hypothetical protein